MRVRPLIIAIALATAVPGCTTTTVTSRTWTAAPQPWWTRPGYVESVQELVERTEGNPAGGAIAGALIGGILFGGRGPATLFGMAGGAAVGAAASQGGYERRTYHVLVRFDDGGQGMFVYGAYPPFQPGQPVVLTPNGLTPR